MTVSASLISVTVAAFLASVIMTNLILVLYFAVKAGFLLPLLTLFSSFLPPCSWSCSFLFLLRLAYFYIISTPSPDLQDEESISTKYRYNTVCPKSLGTIYIETFYIEMGQNLWVIHFEPGIQTIISNNLLLVLFTMSPP